MKKTGLCALLLAVCSVALLTSCDKTGKITKDEPGKMGNSVTQDPTTPYSLIPNELKNKTWFTGTVSAISYYDRNGYKLGNDYEAGREFHFFEDSKNRGRATFWQYLGTRNYSNCVTEIYTYKEGTVVFNGDIFTFYPVSGRIRNVKSNCGTSDGTVIRNGEHDDLAPFSYRWEIIDLDGKPHLYTYDIDDVDHSDVVFVYEMWD